MRYLHCFNCKSTNLIQQTENGIRDLRCNDCGLIMTYIEPSVTIWEESQLYIDENPTLLEV